MKKALNSYIEQFPNIFRFIPEAKIFKKIIKSKPLFYLFAASSIFLSALFIVLIIILIASLYNNANKLAKINKERNIINSKINFWKSVTQHYDGYKDAYFQIAVLEYQLGDITQAKIYDNKALFLDPNYNDAKKLQGLLNK